MNMIFLKRSAIADSGEIDRLKMELTKQQNITEMARGDLVIAQRALDSKQSKISELSGRLKNKNHLSVETDRLTSDLAKMQASLPELQAQLESARVKYEQERAKLAQMQADFDTRFIAVPVQESE